MTKQEFPKMQEFAVKNCLLKKNVVFWVQNQLRYLCINGNKLELLDVSKLPQLYLLDAFENQLTHVVFGENPNLNFVNLSKNKL